MGGKPAANFVANKIKLLGLQMGMHGQAQNMVAQLFRNREGSWGVPLMVVGLLQMQGHRVVNFYRNALAFQELHELSPSWP